MLGVKKSDQLPTEHKLINRGKEFSSGGNKLGLIKVPKYLKLKSSQWITHLVRNILIPQKHGSNSGPGRFKT
jgi:hypothetical protein